MNAAESHYEVLGVAVSATPDQIKRAYRAQIRLWHPDTNKTSAATERAAAINRAWDVLKDAERRAAYDRQYRPRTATSHASQRGGARPASSPRRSTTAGGATSPGPARSAASAGRTAFAWDDAEFVIGHWYATKDGVAFTVTGIADGDIDIKYESGTTGRLKVALRWEQWRRFAASRGHGTPAEQAAWTHTQAAAAARRAQEARATAAESIRTRAAREQELRAQAARDRATAEAQRARHAAEEAASREADKRVFREREQARAEARARAAIPQPPRRASYERVRERTERIAAARARAESMMRDRETERARSPLADAVDRPNASQTDQGRGQTATASAMQSSSWANRIYPASTPTISSLGRPVREPPTMHAREALPPLVGGSPERTQSAVASSCIGEDAVSCPAPFSYERRHLEQALRSIEQSGIARIEDHRATGGLVAVFAHDGQQPHLDAVMQVLIASGAPFKRAQQGSAIDGKGVWWMRERARE